MPEKRQVPWSEVSIPNAFSELFWVRKEEGEDTLWAQVRIFGVQHHVMFVKVEENDEGIQVGTNDPHNRLDDIAALNDGGAFETVEVPGFSGEWVACVFPHC